MNYELSKTNPIKPNFSNGRIGAPLHEIQATSRESQLWLDTLEKFFELAFFHVVAVVIIWEFSALNFL